MQRFVVEMPPVIPFFQYVFAPGKIGRNPCTFRFCVETDSRERLDAIESSDSFSPLCTILEHVVSISCNNARITDYPQFSPLPVPEGTQVDVFVKWNYNPVPAIIVKPGARPVVTLDHMYDDENYESDEEDRLR